MSSVIQPDPSAIGAVSTPPFAVLPDPATLFAARAARLRRLSSQSPMSAYLDFVAGIIEAQHAIVSALPDVEPPDPESVARARQFEMPPLDRSRFSFDTVAEATLDALFDAAAPVPKPDAAAAALARVAKADAGLHAEMAANILAHAIPVETMAEHMFVAAGLQVHFARLAAGLDAKALVPVGDAICPACGGPPAASLIVEWPNAHGSRFCACGMCGTLWNYVRIRCTSCGSTKGIGYQEIEGGKDAPPATVKAETCDECRTYVKVLYQHRDVGMEPVADDVASLGLDILMQQGPYRRAAFNPFLLGY